MAFQFTDQQLEAIPLLASGQSYNKVAIAVGTSKATVCRWLKNTEFKQQVEAIQQEKLEITKSAVTESATTKAVKLQDALKTGLQHQEEILETTRQITTRCLTLLSEVTTQIDRLARDENRDTLTQREKALLAFMPNLMRNTAALITLVNDTWDRRYSIAEISNRLDQWQNAWGESDRN